MLNPQRRVGVLLLCTTFLAVQVLAQSSAPTPDADWQALKNWTGEKVVLVFEGENEMNGTINAATNRDVMVDQKRFLKEQIVRVYIRRKDPLGNGLLLGATIGFAAGFLVLYLPYHVFGNAGGTPDMAELGGATIGTAIGLAAGGLSDWARKSGKEILYQRP